MKNHQLGSPHIIENGSVHRLERVGFDERGYNEDQLQSLLFEQPSLLPAADIEPVFRELLSVCRELPTPAGPLDLVCITPNGDLCLVETKLWRNHEARREVVAQIIDYAKEIAGWAYEDLVDAIGRSKAFAQPASPPDEQFDSLAAIVADEAEDFDEQSFIDAVSRNLRLGRFLLLIVGDGIREDVEKITDFLQQTPNLKYTLGLIEIGMYRLPGRGDGELLFQPRTLCKTVNIERAIVEIRNNVDPNLQIDVSLPMPKASAKKTGRSSMTEDAFFDSLKANASPKAVAVAREVLDKASEYGIDIAWGDAGPMLKYDTGQDTLTFGQMNRHGQLTALHWLGRSCHKHGIDPALARKHHALITTLLPGTDVYDRKLNKKGQIVTDVRTGDRIKIDRPRFEDLAGKVDQWLGAITETAEQFDSEIERVGDSEA